MIKRCAWVETPKATALDIAYHDQEWGVPVHDERTLFEFLILEGAQAGLNWSTILKKREAYRLAYDNFEPQKVARYREARQHKLLHNSGIIRNQLKISASITNAKAFLAIQKEFGSFDAYIWQFAPKRQRVYRTSKQVPATSKASEQMSDALKKRGFKFVGPTICYAFMQAIGIVNDHTTDCYRHHELQA